MIWYATIRYDMKWRDVTWRDMTGHDVTAHDIIWYDMKWYDMIWHNMIWYNMWYDMMWYDMVWYDMIWYDIMGCNEMWYMILYDMIYYDMLWYMTWHDMILQNAHNTDGLHSRSVYHDDVIKWKHLSRYWPFVRGIHWSRWIPRTKASDAELWCFLWSAPE